MNYIIAIFFSIILPIISLKQSKSKICINCKYFIHDNSIGEYGKCSLFPKKEGDIKFLVNGINEKEYSYCYTLRENDNMCGKEGKYYKKKMVKNEDIKTKNM